MINRLGVAMIATSEAGAANKYVSVLSGRGILRKVVRSFRKQAAEVRPADPDGWLQEKARQIAEQMRRFEREYGRLSLRPADLPEQTARRQRSARDRRESIASMWREVRAPLDSMLTLSKLLADNTERHLSPRQVDYAQTIYSSATQLIAVIDAAVARTMPKSARSTDAALRPAGTSEADNLSSDSAISGHTGVDRHREAPQIVASAGELVVIVEGDPAAAEMMLDLVHDNGYQACVASRLDAVRALVQRTQPGAIILGSKLLDADAWTVLDVLRHDPATCHIPLCMVAAAGGGFRWLQLGESGMSPQPVGMSVPVAEESRRWRDGAPAIHDVMPIESLRKMMLAESLVEVTPRFAHALPGVPWRLSLSYRDGTAEVATLKESSRLEALLEDTTLFLHDAVSTSLKSWEERLFPRFYESLTGRKVLLVDDDIRSVYALTGSLEDQGMTVVNAEDGNEAMATLGRDADIAIVLLNVGMATVDAEDLIRRVRGLEGFGRVPVIAMTRQSDSGDGRNDHEHWMHAGASDDIAGPANIEQLLCLLRAHLNNTT